MFNLCGRKRVRLTSLCKAVQEVWVAISPQTEVTSLVQIPSGSWGLGLGRPTSGFPKTGCPFVRQHNGEKLSDLLPKSACYSVTHVV